MNHQFLFADALLPWPVLLPAVGIVLVTVFFGAIWASRFRRVGPNQVLIVSGRQRRLPNGQVRGFRIVKGGGTFVVPVIEKMDTLSLEVLTAEWRVAKARMAQGGPVDVNCALQAKIKGDDDSIMAAAEHFLGKDSAEIKKLSGQLLEKHLRRILETLSPEELDARRERCAADVQAAAAEDLARMGLAIVNFTIRP